MIGNQYAVKHGMHATRTYKSWRSMINRCTNPNTPGYASYGGRGITVCDRWLIFEPFLADMGVRPEGRTLDRINNDGNYEPGNCRWATRFEQQRNKRPPVREEFCKNGHEYAVDGVYVSKNGARQCKPCAKARANARRT
jgi:hypothetical protein